MLSEQTRVSVQRFWRFLEQGNLNAAGDYVAADYQYHGPGGSQVSGVDGFRDLLSSYFAAFPDLSFTVHDIVCESDRAVSRFTATGTHRGELMGLAPTGKTVSFDGMLIARVADGKIAEEWEVLDEMSMMQQLGVLPAN